MLEKSLLKSLKLSALNPIHAIGLIANMIIRYVMRKRADEHEASMKEQAIIRKQQLAEASGRNDQFASDEDEEAL